MEISRTTIAILALACVAAGAGGTYLALRGEAPPVSAAEPQESPAPVDLAVAESEAIVEAPPELEPPTAVAPPPKPARPVQPAPQVVGTPERRAPAPAPRPAAPPPGVPVVTNEPLAPIAPAPIADNQASRFVEPPGPVFEELVVSADSVIGLQLETPVSSERAQVEDSIVARVTRDVRVGDRIAIPSGARAFGEVTLVERGGKVRERARLGVRFTSVVLADGTRLPILTETVYREGEPPGRESAAKIGGGAVGGAILGGILGGARGAAIGGSIGAGAGTAAVVAGDRNHATLSAGSTLTVRLEEPVVVTVER